MQTLNQAPWLKKTIPNSPNIAATMRIMKELSVNTVCHSARCPNVFECFSKRRATFLILGTVCTRNCAFCYVEKGLAETIRPDEPKRIAEAVLSLGLRHVIVTSVTRDDLPDGGSKQFTEVMQAIRGISREKIYIEVLIPDFKGSSADIKRVVYAKPDIFSHNVETVPSLYSQIRPEADYLRSLDVLKLAKDTLPGLVTKSAIMLGLGEKEKEVIAVMEDLKAAGCDMLAIGQYLQPSSEQVSVKEFVSPQQFMTLKDAAYLLGFKYVQSGPFVRSSYVA